MSILLSGPPFSGKTTIAKELSKILDRPLIELDSLLENKHSLSCSQQFKQFGEEQFRKNEYAILKELEGHSNMRIISLGGGVLTYEPSAGVVKRLGMLVCLECSFDTLFKRMENSEKIPAYLDENNLQESFLKLLTNRKESYERYADYFLDISHSEPITLALQISNEFKRRHGN